MADWHGNTAGSNRLGDSKRTRAFTIAIALSVAFVALGVGRALAYDTLLFTTRAAAHPDAGYVAWGTDSNEEGNAKLDIASNPGSHNLAEVLYSVEITGPIASGEPIRVRGEAQLSFCTSDEANPPNPNTQPSCPDPYDSDARGNNAYSPEESAEIILADHPGDVTGTALVDWIPGNKCTEDEHHCPLALSGPATLAASSVTKYVNLVVSAAAPNSTANVQPNDKMIIDDGNGKLDAIRIGSGRCDPITGCDPPTTHKAAGSDLLDGDIEIWDDSKNSPSKRSIVLRKQFSADQGEIVDVGAALTANPPSSGGRLLSSTVIISPDKDAHTANSSSEDMITAKNGTNCQNGCTLEKHGATCVPAAAVANGPKDMYVILLGWAVKSNGDGSAKFRVPMNSSTYLNTRVYDAPSTCPTT